MWVLKGDGNLEAPVASAKPSPTVSTRKWDVNLYRVGTHQAKETIFERFRDEESESILLAANLPDAIDRELSAEELRDATRKGKTVQVYHAGKRRNKALDCLVYALAVIRLSNPNWDDIQEEKVQEPKEGKKDNGNIEDGQTTHEEYEEDEEVYEIEGW